MKAVKSGSVFVDGVVAKNPAAQIKPSSLVLLNGKDIVYRENVYLMLNKPVDYICSTKDGRNKTVLELLPPELSSREPFACGRLDIDTTGLVLLTDDGKWAHNITSPKKKCFKSYVVKSLLDLTEESMQQLREGVMLDGDDKVTLPAEIVEISSRTYRLKIQEGRFHQVKRMFTTVGNRVLELHRSSIGDISLDDSLKEGEWRELTDEEVILFKN